MQEAETISGKSRATLVRLCQKIETTGNAFKDDRARWHIDKAYLVQHISKATPRKAEATKEPEKDSLVQWLQSRIEALEKQANALLQSNYQLLQENSRLKELNAPGATGEGRRVEPVYIIAVVVLSVVALILLWIAFF